MITIEALAHSLPEACLRNSDLRITYPEWDFDRLEQRTGVLERRVAAEGETALDFAVRCCEELESQGKLRAAEIDGVIFCTQTPDHIMPPNACLLHGRLNLKTDALAFDINLACSGYVYGLKLASALIDSGAAKRILFATADTYTRYIHPGDRATRCLFGDGGAVSLLSASQDGRGVREVRCGTDGKHYQKFMICAGGMRVPRSDETARETVDRSGNVRTPEHIQMDGMGVLSFFNSAVPRAVREYLSSQQVSMEDVDLFVFHQASKLALESIQSGLKIPRDKMLYDLSETGNLVSASIPVALHRALQSGRVKSGQRALLCGFGVGLSWGTALVDL